MNKILICNRGAIARRVVRACRALGKRSVVVYSEADAGAPYLDEADEAFGLPGSLPLDTYLNQDALLEIARQCGADAVHPGYGFLAENAEFAERVIAAGMTFIGPQPRWLAEMGDKVAARRFMQEQGFPIFAGSDLLTDDASAVAAAAEIGYPVLVKPSGGGGGMGMQAVSDEAALVDAVKRAQAVSASAFGSDGVYLERLLERPRHIEFQIAGDGQGGAVHVYERECSVQRRNQKLIEESPAPGIDDKLVRQTAELAARVCGAIGYDNVGTLETLFTPDGEVGFLEMNTRIQVEHGVTEMVTGCDLVQLQISLAEGGALPQTPARHGYAIEARLYAEDPRTLMPSTGLLAHFHWPELHGVRIETGYRAGQHVTPFYDALLAKIIAHGETREMAIGRLLVALRAFEVSGVTTNAELLMRVLQDQNFLQGRVDTSIVPRILNDQGEEG